MSDECDCKENRKLTFPNFITISLQQINTVCSREREREREREIWIDRNLTGPRKVKKHQKIH